MAKAIPDGYHTVTPYITVKDAPKLVAFLKQTFDANVKASIKGADGNIVHAEVLIGDSMVMVAEANSAWKHDPASLYIYVPNVDEVYKKALAAGATSAMEVADQFYGDRSGGVKDFAGNSWWIGTHVEDVSPEELQKRSLAAGK